MSDSGGSSEGDRSDKSNDSYFEEDRDEDDFWARLHRAKQSREALDHFLQFVADEEAPWARFNCYRDLVIHGNKHLTSAHFKERIPTSIDHDTLPPAVSTFYGQMQTMMEDDMQSYATDHGRTARSWDQATRRWLHRGNVRSKRLTLATEKGFKTAEHLPEPEEEEDRDSVADLGAALDFDLMREAIIFGLAKKEASRRGN